MAIRRGGVTVGMARRDPCAKCGLPVFIAERLNVGKQLYHRTCFRCARCSSQLTLANYYETETAGQFCCETCPDEEEPSEKSSVVVGRSLSDEEKSKLHFVTALEFPPDTASESEFTRARSFFLSQQLADSGDEPPDLPKSKPPDNLLKDSCNSSDSGLLSTNSSVHSVKDLSFVKDARGEAVVTKEPDVIVVSDDSLANLVGDDSVFESPAAESPKATPRKKHHDVKLKTPTSLSPTKRTLFPAAAADSKEEESKVFFGEVKLRKTSPEKKPSSVNTRTNSAAATQELVPKPEAENIKTPEIDDYTQPEDGNKMETDDNLSKSKDNSIKNDVNEKNEVLKVPKNKVESKPDEFEALIMKNDVNKLRQHFDGEKEDTDALFESLLLKNDLKSSRKDLESSLVKNDVTLERDDVESRLVQSEREVDLKTQQDEIETLPMKNDVEEQLKSRLVKSDGAAEDTDSLFESLVNKGTEFKEHLDTDLLFESLVKDDEQSSKNENVDTDLMFDCLVEDKVLLTEDVSAVDDDFEKLVDNLEPGIEVIESQEDAEIANAGKEYPGDLNPFGEEEHEAEKSLNPFGDDEEEAPPHEKSLNPFGDDDDDGEHNDDIKEEVVVAKAPQPLKRKGWNTLPQSTNPFDDDDDDHLKEEDEFKKPRTSVRKLIAAPKISLPHFWADDGKSKEGMTDQRGTSMFGSSTSISSSSASSAHSVRKKKAAPRPPVSSATFVDQSSPLQSLNTSPSPSVQNSPRPRKSKRAPAPPTSTPSTNYKLLPPSDISPINESTLIEQHSKSRTLEEEEFERTKDVKDEKNRNRQSQSESSTNSSYGMPNKSTYGKWKRKKGLAPARPIPQKRTIKALPVAEVRRELDIIEVQQQGLEKQGVRLEQIIREKCEGPNSDAESAVSIEAEDLILQLFEVVNEKNELCRRQAELMYLQRQQRLEEEHAEIEYQIRCLMLQPEANKTDTDKAREELLILRLVDIVERRNEIIECLEMDRVREAEEDDSICNSMNTYATKRDENLVNSNESPKKKEKKKFKKKFKLKSSSPKIDMDKDVDECEASEVVKDKKKKKFNLF